MWARHTEAVRSQSGARPITVLEDEGSSVAVGRSSQPSATGGSALGGDPLVPKLTIFLHGSSVNKREPTWCWCLVFPGELN
ncbi:hypothetical protein RUM44_001562 [Polyplax serrata]|uniref:Uncharacterized protein n=1 Tax=Polyplax serrata TaxID=468196 RepID=A0ABR1AKG1_POLSC